jgi:hypothetical protein
MTWWLCESGHEELLNPFRHGSILELHLLRLEHLRAEERGAVVMEVGVQAEHADGACLDGEDFVAAAAVTTPPDLAGFNATVHEGCSWGRRA